MMAKKISLYGVACFFVLTSIVGCIRPAYYQVNHAPEELHFRPNDFRYGQGYFRYGQAYEAYIEFNERGALYRDHESGDAIQFQQALELIRRCRFRQIRDTASCGNPDAKLGDTAKPIALYIFINGWKNNASNDANNPWGFRRFLSVASYRHPTIPVIGIYMGWPGASLKGDLFLSFWNREPIADAVGNSNDLRMTLKRVLHEAKGELKAGDAAGTESLDQETAFSSSDPSLAVVIGHSFGGIVLEHAATALLQETFNALPRHHLEAGPVTINSPADLFVLINEAGASSIAMPFLDRLKKAGVKYECHMPVPTLDQGAKAGYGEKEACPLLLSMTSEGDFLTKLAYPGGEFLSFNRPATVKYDPVDQWGQGSSLPYSLVTAANFIALQNHSFAKVNDVRNCFVSVKIAGKTPEAYCMQSSLQALNQTPYWIMQLPQYFVPDHGTVFQASFLKLLDQVARARGLTLTVPSENVRALQSR